MDILSEIIAHKRLEIEQQKAAISQELLINNCNEPMPEGDAERLDKRKRTG